DHDQQPIAAASVFLRAPENNASWYAWHNTDSAGLASFPHLPFERVVAHVSHPDHGWITDVDVPLSELHGEPFVIVFDCDARVRARLLDGTTQLAQLPVRIDDQHGNNLTTTSSSAAGEVTCGPLCDARLRLQVSAPGYWPTSAEVQPAH